MTNEAPQQSLQHCPSCGIATQAQWLFCGACGGTLANPVAEPAEPNSLMDGSAFEHESAEVLSLPTTTGLLPDSTDTSVGGRVEAPVEPAVATAKPASRRALRRWLTAGACLVVACLVALGVVAYFSTKSDLTDTRNKLKSTSATLASTQGKLEETLATLTHTQSDLSSTQHQRDDLQNSLNDANAKLAGLQNSLNDANTRVNGQASQIETLKACLAGVLTALSDSANFDYDGAISALNAVQVSCTEAGKLF